MKNKNLYKRLVCIVLCLNILLNIVPMEVNAATTSVPGAEGHVLDNIIPAGTFEGGYDSTILVYSTPNVSDSIKYEINDNMAIFEIPAYDSNNWYFDGWRTWYKGSQLGAGVITSDKANPKYNDDLNYFERNSSMKLIGGVYYNAGSMSVYKEDSWKGTYYLSAIFKPIVTVNVGDGVTYTVSNGTNVNTNKYAVTYGSNTTINYTITDSRYIVTGVNASHGTNYSEQDGKVSVNTVERPTTITIDTALKQQAKYTAPTAKNLIYNTEQQELVNKGTSSEGTLMYSLEENGTYSENVPKAKDVGDYIVWYYVKGDTSHLDSDKQYVKVSISKANTDIGTVTAEIPNDTTDISKVVLNRTNKTILGTLKVKESQTLVFGNNQIDYIFMPDDNNYKTVEGKVNVKVTDTIAPVGTVSISGAKPTIWNKILNTITFGLLFGTDQIVEVNVSDNLSGIHSIEYYESKEALELDTLKSLADEDWKTMSSNSVKVTAEDGKQFVYYIRVTDNAGNIMMMSTDGALFDTTAPIISGIEDGKTYNTTQTITIADKNLEKVTLNGEDATDTIVIEEEGNYVIIATDKAGNSNTVTVKIEKLEETDKPEPENPDEDIKTYKIIFDANGGTFKDDVKSIDIKDIIKFDYETFEKPTRESYTFIEFYTADNKSYYDVMNSEAGIEKDTVFYARWEEVSADGEQSGIPKGEEQEDNNTGNINTGNANTDNTNTNKPTGNNPQTSDDIMLFVIILGVSIIGLITTTIIRKKLKNN